MTDTTLRQALAYARRGWPVFPCLPGQKIPATRHGFRDATTDEQQITEWFGRGFTWNLAIATGAPGPDVLDVDQHGPDGTGFPAYARLRRAGLLTGASAYVRTPSGGLHAYFTGTAPAQRPPARPSPGLPLRRRLHPGPALPRRRPPLPAPQDHRRPRHPRLGTPSPSCCNPSGSSNGPSPARPPAMPSTAWPAGSRPSPRATATRACSGPPTAPWRPTRPPT